MQIGKYHLDIRLLIALTVLLTAIILSGGAILTWGPADSRAVVIDWGAKGLVGLAGLYGILRGRGLVQPGDGEHK